MQGTAITGSQNPAAVLKVGPRLRTLRKAKGMSLAALSEQADLSIGMLSQVERGLSSPSLASLSRIAAALGVAAIDLFDARPDPIAAVALPIQRAAEHRQLRFEEFGMVKQILSPARSHRLELILVELEPGGCSSDGPYTHDGEEGGLVLEGALELEVDGRRHALRAGDSFQFQSALPHCFRNIHAGVTRALWAITTAPPELGESVQT